MAGPCVAYVNKREGEADGREEGWAGVRILFCTALSVPFQRWKSTCSESGMKERRLLKSGYLAFPLLFFTGPRLLPTGVYLTHYFST